MKKHYLSLIIVCMLLSYIPSKAQMFDIETQLIENEKPLLRSNNYVPNSVVIDKTKAVGEIPMQSGLSPSGAITYSVPIEVYPGVRNMQPQLAVVYSSQAGNGVLGMGWNISGLSSVTRGNRSMYYDGKVHGIALTKDDAFYLDGMRLIKLSETSAQIKFESEQGNIKATAHLNGNIVKYFDVFYPNGTRGTYGHSINAGTNYLQFPLTVMSDLYNNTINYLYNYTDNNYRITKISYANASIEFQYQASTRPDIITAYSGGLKVREDKLLQKIICKYGTAVLRNYDFTYAVQKESSLLTRIAYSAANGAAFNPLQFYYGENNNATVYSKKETTLLNGFYSWTDPNLFKVSKGKFDYGTEDEGLIVFPGKNSYQSVRSPMFAFVNKYTGTEDIFLYTGLSGTFSTPVSNLKTEAGFIDIFCANTDGRKEEEVIKVNNIVSGNNDRVIFKSYAANPYANALTLKHTRTFDFQTLLTYDIHNSVHPKFYFAGDFNGDGRMEILAVSCHQPFGNTNRPTKYYLFDLETGVKLFESAGSIFPFQATFEGEGVSAIEAFDNTDRLFVFDYDGDGKSDLCMINTTGTYIYTFDVTGSSYSMRQVAGYTGLKRADLKDKVLLIGEFNGDGKPDLLLSPKVGASDVNIFYSKGEGQFEKSTVFISTRLNTYRYCLQDVNSDGLTDLLEYTQNGFSTYRVRNGGFSSAESYATFNSTNPILVPTNLNSRYSYSQVIALKDNKVTRFSYPRNDAKEKLLTGSVTSFGVVGKNYYSMLNESQVIHTIGSGANFPFENFNGSFLVPTSREQYFNGTRNENLSYSYQNAVIHKQGLGFRGFERITTRDVHRGRTQYQVYDPYNFSVLKEEDSPVAKNTNTYSFSVASNKIAKVRMTNRSSLDKLKNLTVTASYTYDTYGHPLTETINYGGGITASVTNDYFYNLNETGYLLGYLYDRTKRVTRNSVTLSERYHTPAHSNGQPSVKILYSNGYQVSYETFAYNTNGTTKSHGVRTYTSSTSLTTNYVFDSYGRMTKETDPLGFNTTFEYNASNGSLSKEKNHKNQETVFSYDPFWRISQINHYTGEPETSSYFWTTEKGTNTLYCNYRHHHGRPWTKNFYDALGRETASNVLILGGAESGPCKLYDSFGRLQKVSLPVTSGTPSLWNEYQYDLYDRITRLTEASGRITTNSYSNNSVTTTRDGIASTQTFDTQGNLTQVTDPAGTITYNLRPDGQPSSIVAPGSISTTFTYDHFGRRLSISDPSAGTQSFTYDVAGNIATEKDANNKTISYLYDIYNRMVRKITPEFTVNYRYNSDGLLAADSINSTRFTAYTYDNFGRPLTERETVATNQWFRKDYWYWGNGRLGGISYYNANGFITGEQHNYVNETLKEITVNGNVIFRANAVNMLGQTTNITTGNFTRSYNYNSFGMPTGRTAGSLQNHTYSFDAAKGNLLSRKDNVKNIQENFTYDNLNRLTNFAGKTTGYDVKGNITGRSDVGTSFQYNIPGKPYSVSGVTSPTNLIPQRNQTVTYTSFKRPNSIAEGEYTSAFTYNGNGDRVKMELKKNGAKDMDRYYMTDRYEVDDRAVGGIKQKVYLGGNFYTAPAVFVKEGSGNWNIYYICRDYLGSITHITNSSGVLVQELSYDAWGQLRNPSNQAVYTPGSAPELFLGRGYTGHEHLPVFGLVNMNARLYDPALGRFLSPDPYVQAPDFSQSFNRYSYALNNPFRYTDPDGELWWLIPVAYFVFFTDAGYQLQKYVSPVAVHIDVKIGTHQIGIGFNAGVGIPKFIPYAPWKEYGKTYFWKNYGGYKGWETRKGSEITYWGLYTEGQTKYQAGEFSQIVGYKKIGVPGNWGIDVYNDLWGDGGDRFRTSRVRINFGGGNYIENVIFTGDPGLNKDERFTIENLGPNGTYTKNPNDPYAPDPDKYRHGVLSLGIGPFSFGYDSEKIRYQIQSTVHKRTKSRDFRYLPYWKSRWYFQFGTW